jgi:hypothetical protein
MDRISFIALALFILPALAHAQQPRKKPNVIVIITDDQRWNAMSLAGHKHLKTPGQALPMTGCDSKVAGRHAIP